MTPAERRRAKRNRGVWWALLLLPVWAERLLTIFAIGLALYAVVVVQGKADRAEVAVAQQREGRKVAVRVLCGGLQAVIDAGRAQLAMNIQPPQFRHNLERLGLPDARTRRKAARMAADGYAAAIATAIERQSGVKGVVTRQGDLRCELLVSRARAK